MYFLKPSSESVPEHRPGSPNPYDRCADGLNRESQVADRDDQELFHAPIVPEARGRGPAQAKHFVRSR